MTLPMIFCCWTHECDPWIFDAARCRSLSDLWHTHHVSYIYQWIINLAIHEDSYWHHRWAFTPCILLWCEVLAQDEIYEFHTNGRIEWLIPWSSKGRPHTKAIMGLLCSGSYWFHFRWFVCGFVSSFYINDSDFSQLRIGSFKKL